MDDQALLIDLHRDTPRQGPGSDPSDPGGFPAFLERTGTPLKPGIWLLRNREMELCDRFKCDYGYVCYVARRAV